MRTFRLMIALAGFAGASLVEAAAETEAPAAQTKKPAAQTEKAAAARPVFLENGTVRVPPFELPLSEYMSDEARALLSRRAALPGGSPSPIDDIEAARAHVEKSMAPMVAMMKERYPADIEQQTIGGVPTRVVTPRGKPFDEERVLINLHGGAFSLCAEGCALLESIPVAVTGGYKVISVDYRMAPEAKHPAAVEDVAKVYREVIKEYKPSRVGIYGCSAGGALTAQTAAWLPAHGLPQAGAVGIFGAGGVPFGSGDSAFLAGYIDGSFPPPAAAGQPEMDLTRGYFAAADMEDPVISPALHPAVLAKFPPSLIITGTRAMDLSPAVYTNSELLKAGVDSRLIVGEGMGHCYFYMPQLPESQDAYQATVDFFRKHL